MNTVRLIWADGVEEEFLLPDGAVDDPETLCVRRFSAPDLSNWWRHSPDDPAPIPVAGNDTVFYRVGPGRYLERR